MSYCLANSNIWKDIFNIDNLNDIINTLKNWFLQCGTYVFNERFRSKCIGFHFDQQILFKYLESWKIKTNNLILFNLNKRKRLKPMKNFNAKLELELIKKGFYDDYIFLRPFKEFHQFKLDIKNIILNS